ncbi:MAG TPA: tetratricopeptide repeat protein, partial [Candidatus Sumerlaeota bacterium]|nr:tetratricopeptide repeat protein [Candidatus Sumerlaeota bacterium]
LPETSQRSIAAFAGAALFALHPIQCESVLWPAARPAVLGWFFMMLGFHAFAKLFQPSKFAPLLAFAAVGCFVASLLSKEIAVAVPLIACMLFLMKSQRPPRSAIFTAVAGVFALVVYLVLNSAIGSSAQSLGMLSITTLIGRGIKLMGFYVWLLLWPLNLNPSYGPQVGQAVGFTVAGVMFLLPVAVVVFVGLFRRTRLALLAAVGILFFVGSSSLPLLGGQFTLADRYTYQGMAGLGIAAAAILAALGARTQSGARILAVLPLGVVVVITLLSLRQSLYWISSESLWTRVVELEPTNRNAHMYLGGIEERRGKLKEAEAHFAAPLVGPQPPSEAVGNNLMALARVQFALGRNDEAVATYRDASQIPLFRNDAMLRAAIVEFSRGNRDAAQSLLRQFSDGGNETRNVYLNRALLALRMEKDTAAALQWYRKAREKGAPPNADLEALAQAPS